MKKLLILSVFFAIYGEVNAQQPKLNLAKKFSDMKAVTMQLFKFDKNNLCNQSKAASVVFDNKISTCFTYLKTFKADKVKKFINSLKDTATYGNIDVACFDTDYAVVFYNSQKVVVGYINISMSCNKLVSTPIIPERQYFVTEQSRKVGFSIVGRKKIVRLLGLSK